MTDPLRLVKVTLQAEFVVDDGETLTPAQFGPFAVIARDWPSFDLQARAEAALAARENDEAPE